MFSEDYLADTDARVREFQPDLIGISLRNLDNSFPSIEEAKDFVESFRPWELYGTQGVTVDPEVRPALESATTDTAGAA